MQIVKLSIVVQADTNSYYMVTDMTLIEGF